MTREVKTIFLAALTLTLYAVSIFLKEGGSLVFPFPLNPFIFFVVAIQFAVWNWNWKNFAVVTVATAVLGVLASEVFWEIILSIENLEHFYSHPWFYWCYLLYSIGLLVIAVLQMKEQNNVIAITIALAGAASLGLGQLFGFEIFIFIGLFVLMFSAFYKRVSFPIHLLWALLFFLNCTMWITYLFS